MKRLYDFKEKTTSYKAVIERSVSSYLSVAFKIEMSTAEFCCFFVFLEIANNLTSYPHGS